MDVHHRRAHAHTRDECLKATFILAVKVGHIGRRATHVKTYDSVEPTHGGSSCHADNAASRPGQDRILALEQAGIRQSAVGLHEHESRAVFAVGAEFIGNLLNVAAQDWRQVGVNYCCVGTRDQLDQWTGLVA